MSLFGKIKEALFKKYGDDLATEGADAYNKGRTTEGIAKLTDALELEFRFHSRDKILTVLGNAYLDIEEYEKAIAAHEEAIEVNPKNHQAWVNLGIACRKEGNVKRAEECYRKAIDLKPDYAEVHASLGALYIFMADGAQAVESLEHARQLDPSVAVTHGNLALAYAMQNRFEDAEAAIKQAGTLGYRNEQSVRERMEYLRALHADQSEQPHAPGEYHLVCANCGTKKLQLLLGDAVGDIMKCGDCGGPMTRFSTN